MKKLAAIFASGDNDERSEVRDCVGWAGSGSLGSMFKIEIDGRVAFLVAEDGSKAGVLRVASIEGLVPWLCGKLKVLRVIMQGTSFDVVQDEASVEALTGAILADGYAADQAAKGVHQIPGNVTASKVQS